MEKIESQIIMLSEEEGGRATPLSREAFNGAYRPHIVIGERTQRKAIVEATPNHPSTSTENYQGVAFIEGPDVNFLPIGESLNIVLALMYFDENKNKYQDVIPGATFTLREGGKIIGHGEIKSRYNDDQSSALTLALYL